MNITIPTVKGWGGIYRDLELAMKVHGVETIGDPEYRTKNADRFKNSKGEVRYASLDMNSDSRCLRTLAVRRLTNDQVERLHEQEKKLGEFINNINGFFKIDISEVLTEERMEALKELNNRHRPQVGTIYGVKVFSYFPNDWEFDGMEYHMSWDKNVMMAEFQLPDIAIKTKAKSKSFLGA